MTMYVTAWRGRLMGNTDVTDTLQSIEKWAIAYELLERWDREGCSGCICEKCGFSKVCAEVTNLIK